MIRPDENIWSVPDHVFDETGHKSFYIEEESMGGYSFKNKCLWVFVMQSILRTMPSMLGYGHESQ